ncbi:MAG: hypothetical protein HY290_10860 [Planctomycetia bacterium]|nr:hypothetical protein [Planctomycetia bacterium]
MMAANNLHSDLVQPRIALGPVMPGWGSWEWLGADLQEELVSWFSTVLFDLGEMPNADAVFVVKHALPTEYWQTASRAPVIYCPVDRYGSVAEIDADADWLSRCARIVVHCNRLRKYFASYGAVKFLDHHVKFAGKPQSVNIPDGPILWVGVRTNLPPFVDWVNTHDLQRPLIVLTNPENPSLPMRPADYGFNTGIDIRMEVWSTERHLQLLPQVSAAIDIKGTDFRSQHKPPAKAIDFLAAGVPLAMNGDSSVADHLAEMGFTVADPEDQGYWLSAEYWEETRRFGAVLAELLSRRRVAMRARRIIEDVLAEHRTFRGAVPRLERIAS